VLRLGDEAMVLEAVGEPVKLVGRTMLWYRIQAETDDGKVEGFAFGSVLTPIRWRDDLDGDGQEDVTVLTFSPDFKPRVRVRSPAIEGAEAVALDLTIGQAGGTLRAQRVEHPHQPWSLVRVSLCREGGDCDEALVSYLQGPGGAPVLARVPTGESPLAFELTPDGLIAAHQARVVRGGRLVAIDQIPLTPPAGTFEGAVSFHPWKAPQTYRYYTQRWTVTDTGGTEHAKEQRWTWEGFGTIAEGEYKGKTLISTSWGWINSKSGARMSNAYRFVAVEKKRWVYLPKASPMPEIGWITTEAAKHGITIEVDPDLVVRGLSMPRVLHEGEKGRIRLSYFSVEGDEPDKGTPGFQGRFEHDATEVYSHPVVTSLRGDSEWITSRQADGVVLYYYYEPIFASSSPYQRHLDGDDIQWEAPNASERGEYPLTWDDQCGELKKGPERVRGIKRDELRKVGEKDGIALFVPIDEGHPVYTEATRQMKDEEPDFDGGVPLLIFEDDLGSFRKLLRRDTYYSTMACEPVLYLYGDPQQEVRVTLHPDIEITHAVPEPVDHTWWLHPSPTGRVREVGGETRYPFLFWEGYWHHIPRPTRGARVPGPDTRAHLTEILPRLGLRGREIDDFIDSWAGALEEGDCNVIAFHEKERIDVWFPMQIEPEPDTLVRVLMDWWPCDDTEVEDTENEISRAEPVRHGLTAVEWGALRRPGVPR